MICALVVATALSAEGAPPPTASGEALGTSPALYIALLEPMVIASGSSVIVSPISATVRVGAIIEGRHALLAGISFATAFLSTSNGVSLSFMPTYRYHFVPLRGGGFSPYVQAELFVGYASSGGGGGGSVPFGFGGSFGAEQLVTKSFGITAAAGLRYIHSEATGGGGGGVSGNQLGIYASAGLALHF